MLVERDNHLETLIAARNAVLDGRGGIVLVSGEAGIGKTALLEAFRDTATGDCRFLWSACDALFTPRPLGPIHELSGGLGRDVRAALAESDGSSNLFASLVRCFEQANDSAIVIIEDVHWADHLTLDFLLYMGRRIALLPVMFVLSFRSDEIVGSHPLRKVIGDLPQGNLWRIELEPLSSRGVARLCAGTTFDSDAVYEVSGGNAFFVTELIAAGDTGVVPVSVQDAVSSRLARLAEREQHFLETVSVIPGAVHSWLLDALFGADGDMLAMSCVGRRILMQRANGALTFRHELARLATLARITATQARINHRRVLDAYETAGLEPDIDTLVHHAAGALDATRVLALAPAAADRAAAVGSHREAAAHYHTALDFVDEAEPPLAAQLYEGWAYEAGLAERIDDEVIEARKHALTLWRALDRPDKAGENLRWLSRLYWYRGESAKAQRYADEAVRVLERAAPSAERAMAYSLRSQLHMLNDRMDAAIEWGKKALALADEFGNVEAKVHALNNIGTARVFRGNAAGVAQMQESLRLARDNNFHEHAARVYTNLSEYAVEFRDFELAERTMAEGIAFDSRNDLVSWTHYLVGRQAQLRVEQGRLQDAVTIAEGVLRLPKLTLLMKLPALTTLAKARLRMGAKEAGRLLAQALDDAMATDEAQYIVPVRLCRVEAAWLQGDRDTASTELLRLFEYGADGMHDWNAGETATWARRFGLSPPEEFLAGLVPPCDYESHGDHAAAADCWYRIGAPCAAMLASLSTPGISPETLANCIRSARDIGAGAIEEKARGIAREQGVAAQMPKKRRGPYRAARQNPIGLTKREQDVLRLICAGSNNVSIAASLSRSKKTIEHHATSIFRKMNVTNRMEAVLRVQSEPWLLPDA